MICNSLSPTSLDLISPDDVGQVLTLRGELDHRALVEIADCDAVVKLRAQQHDAITGRAQAELPRGDLEAAPN